LKKRAGEVVDDLRDRLAFFEEMGAGFVPAGAGRGAEGIPPSGGSGTKTLSSAAERELREIDRQILGCRLCPLHRLRTRAVPGEGNLAAELMFIGEAPGRDEDVQGRPFVGRAGQLLRRIIAAMKFAEPDVYITNVVKCRPPENRVPHREEVEACWPYLSRQIELIAPRAIVTLGRTPTEYFMPGRAGMSELRGKFGDYQGIPVMPTFHPSYLIRNEGNRELRRMVWEDMKQVMALLGKE